MGQGRDQSSAAASGLGHQKTHLPQEVGREQQRASKGTVGPHPKEGGGFSVALREHDRAAPPRVL